MDGSDAILLGILFGIFAAIIIYDWRVRNRDE